MRPGSSISPPPARVSADHPRGSVAHVGVEFSGAEPRWASQASLAHRSLRGRRSRAAAWASRATSLAVDHCAYFNRVALDFSRPATPTANAVVESFNASLRRECLSLARSTALAEVEECSTPRDLTTTTMCGPTRAWGTEARPSTGRSSHPCRPPRTPRNEWLGGPESGSRSTTPDCQLRADLNRAYRHKLGYRQTRRY
jgi:transposase InsO family protein